LDDPDVIAINIAACKGGYLSLAQVFPSTFQCHASPHIFKISVNWHTKNLSITLHFTHSHN